MATTKIFLTTFASEDLNSAMVDARDHLQNFQVPQMTFQGLYARLTCAWIPVGLAADALVEFDELQLALHSSTILFAASQFKYYLLKWP